MGQVYRSKKHITPSLLVESFYELNVFQQNEHQSTLLAYHSKMVFIELPMFIRCANTLFSDDDIAELQGMLLENPAAGALITGGRGLRKLRVPLPGRGKSGGARVIYYHWVSGAQCYLVYAYAKNVAANLTKAQLQRLADLIDTEVKHG